MSRIKKLQNGLWQLEKTELSSLEKQRMEIHKQIQKLYTMLDQLMEMMDTYVANRNSNEIAAANAVDNLDD